MSATKAVLERVSIEMGLCGAITDEVMLGAELTSHDIIQAIIEDVRYGREEEDAGRLVGSGGAFGTSGGRGHGYLGV